jgi:hypothetical protein
MHGKDRRIKTIPGWGKALITALVLVGGGLLIFTQLPRAFFPTDLTQIGQGLPAAVVVRDDAFVAGAEVMERINQVRPDYSERILFLAAHLGHPDGRAFAGQHQVRDGDIVLFAADGRRVGILRAPGSAAIVRRELDAAFPR